jgi:hypothetical protein
VIRDRNDGGTQLAWERRKKNQLLTKRPLLTSLLLLALSTSPLRTESDTSLEKWWNGNRGTGDWLGARPALEDHGINLTGEWIGTFYGGAPVGPVHARTASIGSLTVGKRIVPRSP